MKILLAGEDTFQSFERLKNIKEEFSKKGGEVEEIYEENFDLPQFKSLTSSKSLFGEQLVVLRNVLKKASSYDDFFDFLKSTNGNLVFLEQGKVDSRSKVIKWFKKEKFFEEYGFLMQGELKKWVETWGKRNKVRIENWAVQELTERVGNDLFRLENELKKLKSFKGGDGCEISREDICELVRLEINNNVFETIEALVVGSRVRALESLRKHFLEGEDPSYIFSMYVYQFRNIIIAKDFLERDKFYEINKALRVPPFVLEKVKKQANRFSKEVLLKIFDKFTNLDLFLKSGKIQGEEALEVLVISLTK